MASDFSFEQRPLPHLPADPSPPLVPNKEPLPIPTSLADTTHSHSLDASGIYNRPFPPRASSVATSPPAPNFSRPVGRKALPEPQEAKPLPGINHGTRASSGVHPIITQNTRHSNTSGTSSSDGEASAASRNASTPDTSFVLDDALPATYSIEHRPHQVQPNYAIPSAMSAEISRKSMNGRTPEIHIDGQDSTELVGEPGPTIEERIEALPQLRYPAQPYGPNSIPDITRSMESLGRPKSTHTIGSGSYSDESRLPHRQHLSVGGSPSPTGSPMLTAQGQAGLRHSPDRPTSYIDLLQTPYAQQVAPTPNMDNSFLRKAVGSNASLLSQAKTLEMYRANVKKTNDSAIQYEFAVFLVQMGMELPVDALGPPSRGELMREARSILQRLADRSYPFAQYYLGDGYSSGLFSKGKEDYDHAFPLFLAASKRGHAEAGYRAALCYEFGWGCRKDYAKAVKFYETAASKNHPGAATRLGLACIHNTMGLSGQYRQGVKWLKRAAESADAQYNAAPYELAKLHENGFGDDIFKDEEYAAQLHTQSANLGHVDANLVMGKAYEHGLLSCPQDAALSIHFYTAAAEAGDAEGMMALCAWYLFGAEPVLEQNENEAFEWAKRAADMGFAKAEYAVGYFKEAGIGCKQDSLEANTYYWRAAQQGDERAKQRMTTINAAVSGGNTASTDTTKAAGKRSLFGKLGR